MRDKSTNEASFSNLPDFLVRSQVNGPPTSPFLRWHLRKKFIRIEELFQKYLSNDCKFADLGCGTGDAVMVASLVRPHAELWGLDISLDDLTIAERRMPSAAFHYGDIQCPEGLPKGYFDAVHEFGAAFLINDWGRLPKVYFTLLRDGGLLFWELPRRWSLAHISYLFAVAPKLPGSGSKLKRIFRSFSPWKYHFGSDDEVTRALNNSGFSYEYLDKVILWHFFCPKAVCYILDRIWLLTGDSIFDFLDRATSIFGIREAGYYLIIRKGSSL